MYFTENQKGTIVFSAKVARELLRRGFEILDIKPDKRNRQCTVFVFKVEKDIMQEIYNLTQEDKKQLFA